MASNGKLAPFVLQALVTLFARITKLGWFECTKEDDYVFREIIPHITPFVQVNYFIIVMSTDIVNFLFLFQGNVEFCNIGVQLISNLVLEMK